MLIRPQGGTMVEDPIPQCPLPYLVSNSLQMESSRSPKGRSSP